MTPRDNKVIEVINEFNCLRLNVDGVGDMTNEIIDLRQKLDRCEIDLQNKTDEFEEKAKEFEELEKSSKDMEFNITSLKEELKEETEHGLCSSCQKLKNL